MKQKKKNIILKKNSCKNQKTYTLTQKRNKFTYRQVTTRDWKMLQNKFLKKENSQARSCNGQRLSVTLLFPSQSLLCYTLFTVVQVQSHYFTLWLCIASYTIGDGSGIVSALVLRLIRGVTVLTMIWWLAD